MKTSERLLSAFISIYPFGATSDGNPLRQNDIVQSNEQPLARLKPIDRLTDKTTPDEFDQTVLEYLGTKFGLTDKDTPAYGLIRDSILYACAFAPAPSDFDELAAGKILLPALPGVKNMHALMALLEDFGAVQYAGEVEERIAQVMAEYVLQTEIYSRLKDQNLPAPVGLHEALVNEAMELTTHRYSVNQDVKDKLEAILFQYDG